eukprot:5024779-Pyramimonas_sp.AAC.1
MRRVEARRRRRRSEEVDEEEEDRGGRKKGSVASITCAWISLAVSTALGLKRLWCPTSAGRAEKSTSASA